MSSHTPAQRSAPAPPALTRSPTSPLASPGAFVPPFLGGRTAQAAAPAPTRAQPQTAERALESLPSGYHAESDLGARVADQLDVLAREIRTRGIAALASAPTSDELTRVIAAAIESYVQRTT